jgi:hypothetical protein
MKFIFKLLLANLLFWQPAFATLNEVDKTQIFSKNMLVNGGFESGKTKWTPNDTADFAVTTSSPMVGLQHATWDADASTDTLTSTAVTIPAGFYGRNGVASCLITTASGTATHTIEAYDGSNILSSVTVTSSTTPTRTSSNFIFPSSGSVSLRLYANADEPSIAIDDCYLGPAEGYNVSNVSQSTLWGTASHAGTASCQWAGTSASYANFSADADCPTPTLTVNALAPSTKVPGIRFTNLPPGRYVVDAVAGLEGGTSTECSFTLSDGTSTSGATYAVGNTLNDSPLQGEFTYTAAQSDITFQVQQDRLSGANSCLLTNTIEYILKFRVTRFPTTQETAYTADVTNWLVNVNIAGGNPSLGTATVSTYAGIESASLTLTNHSSATITARIPCSSTNSPSGTTCSAGSESVGVNFNLPKAGSVEACATFGHYFVIASNSADNSLNYTFQLVETASNSQTIVTEGGGKPGSAQGGRFAAGTAIYGGLNRVCSIFKFASAGEKTLRLMYEQVVGGTVNTNIILGDGDASVGGRDIQITVKPVDQSFPAPNLVNSVVSSYSGTTKLERVRVASACSSNPCTIAFSTPNVSSVTWSGTGLYILNFAAGTWSSDNFTCNCTSRTAGAFVCYNTASTSTTWSFSMGTHLAAANGGFDIQCSGY